MDMSKVRMFSKKAPVESEMVKQFSTMTQQQGNPAVSEEMVSILKQFSATMDTVNKNVSSLVNRVSKLEQKSFSVQEGGGQDVGASVPDAEPEVGTLASDGTPPADATPIAVPQTVEYTTVPEPDVVASYSAGQPAVPQVATGTPRLGNIDKNLLLGGKA